MARCQISRLSHSVPGIGTGFQRSGHCHTRKQNMYSTRTCTVHPELSTLLTSWVYTKILSWWERKPVGRRTILAKVPRQNSWLVRPACDDTQKWRPEAARVDVDSKLPGPLFLRQYCVSVIYNNQKPSSYPYWSADFKLLGQLFPRVKELTRNVIVGITPPPHCFSKSCIPKSIHSPDENATCHSLKAKNYQRESLSVWQFVIGKEVTLVCRHERRHVAVAFKIFITDIYVYIFMLIY